MNLNSFPSNLKERIVDKIRSNKLTIIVGPTGCGKSSIVPQILLNSFGPSILCTQPRRLAVVAVASHVANQRGCALGEAVGYHVGQDRVASDVTGLLFATAGILLEELKQRGVDAISKYKAVIIDECHERSCESDLCLTIIKEMMSAYPRSKLRLVLMSATFDHARYSNFFRGVPGCDYIDTITMQSANSIDAYHSQVETLYLEDINRMYREKSFSRGILECGNYSRSMFDDPINELIGDDKGRTLSNELLNVIRCLVMFLDKQESDEKIFLIFAPTYRQLEQIYYQLDGSGNYELAVLHSSIDLEDCLSSMQSNGDSVSWSNGGRRVLLASAIADSSVTIPRVSCVIDTCRALEVKWDPDVSAYQPKCVYASQAICDQRKGRTGRTCAGRVFRLVHQRFYNIEMEKFEQAQLEIASCRTEILALLSSHNKVMQDPQRVLAKSMDPPPTKTVAKAIEYLKDIGACEEDVSSRHRRLVPTDHGRLIAALPFTVEEACVVINGGKKGYLHEALLITAIKSIRPQPIVTSIGQDFDNVNISLYYPEVDTKDPHSLVAAHFAAYVFWYKKWNSIRRQAMADHFELCTSGIDSIGSASHLFGKCSTLHHFARDCKVAMWNDEMEQAHSDWCREHFINPSSVKAISQCIDVVMKILYRADYEPEWLKCQPLEPSWNKNTGVPLSTYDVFFSVYGHEFGSKISNEVLMQIQQNAIVDRKDRKGPRKDELACIHFLRGRCIFGDDCKNAHTFDAPRPPCIFKSRPGGCSNPECLFEHCEDPNANDTIVPAIHGKFEGGVINWYRQNSSTLLLFGVCNLKDSLESLNHPPAVICGEDATRCHTNTTLTNLNSRITTVAWNFPSMGEGTGDDSNTTMIRGFFMSVAALFKSKGRSESLLELAVALQSDEFSKWNVLLTAQHAGFSLQWYNHFDTSAFPGYKPSYSCGAARTLKNARFYVFHLKKHKTDHSDLARDILLHRRPMQFI
jgi:HrpA-like RNA helicase